MTWFSLATIHSSFSKCSISYLTTHLKMNFNSMGENAKSWSCTGNAQQSSTWEVSSWRRWCTIGTWVFHWGARCTQVRGLRHLGRISSVSIAKRGLGAWWRTIWARGVTGCDPKLRWNYIKPSLDRYWNMVVRFWFLEKPTWQNFRYCKTKLWNDL